MFSLFWDFNYIILPGVLIFFVKFKISFNLGTPNVTFLLLTPAKWKVFRVICVAGSPILCAATAPTDSPGLAILL